LTQKIVCFVALVFSLFFIASDSLASGTDVSAAVETGQGVVDRRSLNPVASASFGINIWLWISFGLVAFGSAATLLFLDSRGIFPRRSARRHVVAESQGDALSAAA
jgi:hypothetical protein